jgi:Tol biopolymer transport system component
MFKAFNKTPLKASYLSMSIALAAMVACANASANTFEIEHLPKMQNASNLTLSADGKHTAYTVSKPRDMVAGDKDGSADSHLYVITGSGNPVSFVSASGSVSALQFSRDGSTLFFKTKREDDKVSSLYSISLAGGEAQKRFEFETAIGDYAVSNDGKTLFFVAKEKE